MHEIPFMPHPNLLPKCGLFDGDLLDLIKNKSLINVKNVNEINYH
ncbi:hypothetical protein THOD04_10276 [Vibrio owensii]|nr:hypothetical protein THOD04_10276 [Vibrio owensii]